jgi:hypothetical protein
MQPLRELETVLVAQIDVDECYVRPELGHELNRLSAVGRNTDHVQSLASKQVSGALEEEGIVVDNEAPERHLRRIADRVRDRIPANGIFREGELSV